MTRFINTDSAYLASFIGMVAGAGFVWTLTHIHGVPETVMSDSGAAAILSGFTVATTLLAIAFIEAESWYE